MLISEIVRNGCKNMIGEMSKNRKLVVLREIKLQKISIVRLSRAD